MLRLQEDHQKIPFQSIIAKILDIMQSLMEIFMKCIIPDKSDIA